MIPVDFHAHTLFSGCGIHTHIEMLTRARDLGMSALALTDHGRECGGRIPSTFFDRLRNPVPGIRMLKGIEANLRGLDGEIDVPPMALPHLDLVLLGIHGNTESGLDASVYTAALIAAMERNPCVDMLSHLHPSAHAVDVPEVVRTAKRHGIVVELNNSKLLLKRADPAEVRELVRICKSEQCRIALGSDAHALNEVGRDEHARALLQSESFPAHLLVNHTTEQAYAFIEERRARKKRADG